MGHIRDFYAREMERMGFGDRSLNLKYGTDKKLTLHEVRGQHKTAHYAVQSGNEIRRECLPALKEAEIDAGTETILIFCNLATWDEKQRRFTHKSPYYAGGSYRSGTAWQLDSPELDSFNLKLKKPIIRDGQYGRISLGKHNSIFIGGIAHELGHALGLPHCAARPDEANRGTALMGSGNRTYGDEIRREGRGSFLTLAHALRLASHPQFSGSVKGLNAVATSSIGDLSIRAGGRSIRVSGIVKGEPPIYAVVAYFDPDGGNDYDSTTATAVPAADGRFSLSSSALRRSKPGQLRLFPLHVNGSAAGQMSRTKFRYPYHIADDGTPDLTMVQLRVELAPVLAALARNDHAAARELATKVKSTKAAAIAGNLTRRDAPTKTPAVYDGEEATIALTSLKPKSARVGWERPTYNHIPDRTLLLESGGQLFETGIYAHAPARHIYELGGKWQSLEGQAGLASGHTGSVQFEIKGDGMTLWKSRVLRAGRVQGYKVRLDGIRQLELLTDPTSDGPGSDWSLWLEPVLARNTDR
ncbi:MAG: glycosyl hydrolase family 98 [Planctomycetaceae bacterium]|nr:glycosyl hydrolase family 98 [Planctomycetaceae bacterium]